MILECCQLSSVVKISAIAEELDLSVQAVHQYLKRRRVTCRRDNGAYRASDYWSKDVQSAYRYWRRRF